MSISRYKAIGTPEAFKDPKGISWMLFVITGADSTSVAPLDHIAFTRGYSRASEPFLEERNDGDLRESLADFITSQTPATTLPPFYTDANKVEWLIFHKESSLLKSERWIAATMGYSGYVITVSNQLPFQHPTQDELIKAINGHAVEAKMTGVVPPPNGLPVPSDPTTKPTWPLTDADLKELSNVALDIGAPNAATLATMLYFESNLRTTAVHKDKTGVITARGLNQLTWSSDGGGGANAIGITTKEAWEAITTMSFHEQILLVRKFYLHIHKGYADGGFLYQANIAPASFNHDRVPPHNEVLYRKTLADGSLSKAYADNAGLDHGAKGYIDTNDLRITLVNVSNTPECREIIARLKALGLSGDPVFGAVFEPQSTKSTSLGTLSLFALGLAGAAYLFFSNGKPSRSSRKAAPSADHEETSNDDDE